MHFKEYQPENFYDELFEAPGTPRQGAQLLVRRIESLDEGDLLRRQKAAEASLFNLGVTFAVYGDQAGTEKIFPFDVIPRIVEERDWIVVEKGLKQRIVALNMFLNDIYNEQKILADGVIPRDIIASAASFRKQCVGLKPPHGIWAHIVGTDLVRDKDGQFYVLEDNLRVPSGVSYVLENRHLLKRTFPSVFLASRVKPVDDYPSRLLETLQHLAPEPVPDPCVVVLTPGMYNSAYYEHSFLAQQMGVELVVGSDLVVRNDKVMMQTTKGLARVYVIYRRIDDDFIDPKEFRKDSLLGVPGIMDAYRKGNVALANAPGNGVADDKVVYAFVPKMIEYYLKEESLLPNVPTYLCWMETDRKYVLDNLDKLVVKSANESGGYGMLIGPHSTKKQQDEFGEKIRENPRNFMAQPVVSLSRCPIIVDDHFEGRHVDLRPYILYGEDIYVTPGGLTRVALRKGSLVVNSSQGGGSKDTWVVGNSNGANGGEHYNQAFARIMGQTQGEQSQSQG